MITAGRRMAFSTQHHNEHISPAVMCFGFVLNITECSSVVHGTLNPTANIDNEAKANPATEAQHKQD